MFYGCYMTEVKSSYLILNSVSGMSKVCLSCLCICHVGDKSKVHNMSLMSWYRRMCHLNCLNAGKLLM